MLFVGGRRWERIEWLSPQLMQAREIDPRGAADLVRWLLRTDLPYEAVPPPWRVPQFDFDEQFQDWFAQLKARAQE